MAATAASECGVTRVADSAYLIDLGLREPDAAGGPDAARGPRWSPARRRALLVALAAVALPASFLPSSAVARPVLAFTGEVAVGTATTFEVARDRLFTITPAAGRGRSDIDAWTPAGEHRWSAWVPGERVDLHATATTVTVLSGGGTTALVSTFDLASGRPLWSGEPGTLAVSAVSDRSDRLLVHRTGGPGGDGDALDWLDTRTGRVRWSWTAPAGAAVDAQSVLPGGLARAITQAGDLITVRADDGGAVTVRHLDGLDPIAPPDYRLVTGDGDVVMVLDSEADATRIAAFDAASDRRLWSQVEPGGRFAQPCGPMVCEGTGVALEFYDPRDGRYAWSTAPSYARGWGSDLVVQQYTVFGAGRAVIVNPHTGRPARDLGRWTMIDITAGGVMLLMTPLASETGQWLGTLRPGDPGVRPLGPVPGIADTCAMGGTLIACRRFDGRVTLMEVDP